MFDVALQLQTALLLGLAFRAWRRNGIRVRAVPDPVAFCEAGLSERQAGESDERISESPVLQTESFPSSRHPSWRLTSLF